MGITSYRDHFVRSIFVQGETEIVTVSHGKMDYKHIAAQRNWPRIQWHGPPSNGTPGRVEFGHSFPYKPIVARRDSLTLDEGHRTTRTIPDIEVAEDGVWKSLFRPVQEWEATVTKDLVKDAGGVLGIRR